MFDAGGAAKWAHRRHKSEPAPSDCGRFGHIQLQWGTHAGRRAEHHLHRNWTLVTSATILQIAMPLSRRSAKWFNSTTQIQLRFRRLPERPMSTRFCAVQREWSARASKMSTGWKLVRTGSQVPQLWGSVANQNGGHDDAGIIWRVHTTSPPTRKQHASLLATQARASCRGTGQRHNTKQVNTYICMYVWP